MADSTTVLDIRNLTIRHGSRTLVDDLSLHVDAGEVVALVGESGSGKSLTGRAALGLFAPGIDAQGSIVVGDHDVLASSESELRHLRGTTASMVFQEPQSALNPSQRIGRQLYEVLRTPSHLAGRRTDPRPGSARGRRNPGAGQAHRLVSPPIVRRPETACGDRDRTGGRSCVADRR